MISLIGWGVMLFGWVIHIALLQAVGCFIWLLGLGQLIAKWPRYASLIERLVFGWMVTAGISIIVLTFIYQLWQFSDIVVLIGALGMTGIWFARSKNGPSVALSMRGRIDVYGGIVIASCISMSLMFVLQRFDDALTSPWSILPITLFFQLPLTIIVSFRSKARGFIRFIQWSSILFVLLSVSAIVYANGFGFDPVLHRVHEHAMVQEGIVSPKSWLYSGQYIAVAAIHVLSGLSIDLIDIWLLPVGLTFILPLVIEIGLRKGWGLSDRQIRVLWLIGLTLPFSLITFGVPFTYTFAVGMMTLYLWPLIDQKKYGIPVLIMQVAAACFHPLLMAPLIVMTVGGVLAGYIRKRARSAIFAASTVLASLSTPVLLWIYQIGQGATIELSHLITQWRKFTYLFYSPFTYSHPAIPWRYEFLYEFRYIAPMAILFFGIVFIWRYHRDVAWQIKWLIGLIASLLISLYFTSTLFVFDGIIAHEQSEFALRILTFVYVIGAFLLIVPLRRVMTSNTRSLYAVGMIALFVTHAWYFSYPQYTVKYPFFAPSMGQDDIAIVQKIDERLSSYVSLSNQMTSAAAVQELGYKSLIPLNDEQVLWYAIPTGGPLYTEFIAMVHQGFERDRILQLARIVGVEHIVVIAHDYEGWYWAWFAQLESGADSVIELPTVKAYIYSYADTD